MCDDQRWREAVLVVVALSVFLIGAAQALIGATQVGISTDEPNHQSRMNQWFEHGWYLPARFLDDGEPRDDIDRGRLHAYGAAYSIVGHTVAVATGAEEWGETNRSPDAYVARGFAVALFGIAAAAAVGYAIAVTAGRRLVGLWAAAATMALPLWVGYSMFAVKDVPSGAGWTFVTAGLAVALVRTGGRGRSWAVFLLCAAGVWFSVGVRTALWAPLAVSVAVFAVLAWWSLDRWMAAQRIGVAVGGVTAGLAAVTAFHYRNAATPIQWLWSSVRTSADFHWTGATLSAGQLVTEKPPWWYLPAWMGGSVPLVLGVLAATGFIVAVAMVLRRHADAQPMVLWALQAFMLPTIATVGGATMYAGLRQHLYVLPAIAALAAYAAHHLVQQQRRGWLAAGVLVIALVAPTIEKAQLHPYPFVYKNAVAGPVNDRWEADMHFVSGREALARTPREVEAWCYTKSLRLLSGKIRRPDLRLCRQHRLVRPFVNEQGQSFTHSRDGLWVLGRKYRGSPPAEDCAEVDTVTRRLRFEEVVLSYVLVCDPGGYDVDT